MRQADEPSFTPAPLAALNGQRPEAPHWFEQAMLSAPERFFTEVEGARIETLAWGDVGQPGLLLLHGNGAHADWWSFIAPFFTGDFRVAAMSWSGMGGSDWRGTYSIAQLSREVGAVAQAAGLFEGAARPVLVAHSFGAFPALRYAADSGERLGGVVLVDAPIRSPKMRAEMHKTQQPGSDPRGKALRPNRVYSDLPSALARFRFAPPQVCENLFIADHIARTSLKAAPHEDGRGMGWTWRFDPFQWRDMRLENPASDIAALACPAALMWGSQSALFGAEVLAYVAGLLPAGSPRIEIPAARHHVMVDQPLAFIAALRGLLAAWPR